MTGDTETRRAAVRRARSAPLPRSPAGRPACSAPPLGRPPPAGRRSDRCCPCYPGTCICGGWTQNHSGKESRMSGCHVKEKRIPTLYRRECSRARIAFSGRTRCRDTSSPAEQRERASVRFLVHLLGICVRFAAY